jgi:hypothetical protein
MNGKMYIHGGVGGGSNVLYDIWQYDPLSSGSNTSWQAVGVSTAMGPRAYHTAIPLANGNVFFSGGGDGFNPPFRDAWMWKGSNAWEELALSPSSWSRQTAQLLSNGNVVGLGWGKNGKVMTYSPEKDAWTEESNGPTLNGLASSVVVPVEGGREKIVVFGGYDSNDIQSDAVYDYRPTWSGLWGSNTVRAARMPQGLSMPASAPLPRTTTTVDVVVFGGYATNHEQVNNTYIASFPAAPRPVQILNPLGGTEPSFEFDTEPGYIYHVRSTPTLYNPTWSGGVNYTGIGQRVRHPFSGPDVASYYHILGSNVDWEAFGY